MQLRYGLPAELVVARGIPFRTVCEHHLLPFPGLAHGGYLEKRRADQVNINSWRSS